MSPDYVRDRSLFASTDAGTFVSVDAGSTFELVDPLISGPHENPAPYLARPPKELTPLLGEAQRLYLAFGTKGLMSRTDVAARRHEPVPATLDGVVGFRFAGPAAPPVGFGMRGASPAVAMPVAYRCTSELVCADAGFQFPNGYFFGGDLWARGAGDGKTMALRLYDNADFSVHAWRTSDAGATWHEWTSVQRLVDRVDKTSGLSPHVSVSFEPDRPRTVYLRISGYSGDRGWVTGADPAEQLFRSDDGGTTWRRIGWQRGFMQPGRNGSLPWNGAADGDRGGIYAAGNGVLFAVGTYSAERGPGHDLTLFCSRDHGVHWRTSC